MELAILDFVIIGLIALSLVIGLWRGFFRELFSLITWVAALVGSLKYANVVMPHFERFTQNEKTQYAIALIAIFVVVWIVGSIIGALLAKAMRSIGLGFFDRFLGFVFGAGRGVVLVVILLLVIQSTALQQHAWTMHSALAGYFKPLVAYFEAMIPLQYATVMNWIQATLVA